MKIHVPSIPDEGKYITLEKKLPWIQELIRSRFGDFCSPASSLEGEVSLHRVNQNVTLEGDFTLDMGPTCDRCAQEFKNRLQVNLHRYLTPFFETPELKEEGDEGEEKELVEEDLEFSCYHHEEIDLSDIIAEEVFLALPMRFLCREDCKGLCQRCGQNFNEGPCECDQADAFSPFATLKGMKFPDAPKD